MVALFRPSCNLLPEYSGPPDTNLIPSRKLGRVWTAARKSTRKHKKGVEQRSREEANGFKDKHTDRHQNGVTEHILGSVSNVVRGLRKLERR